VRIVYVRPSRRGQGLPPDERIKIDVPPNYHALHWRPPHVNGVEFAELDSYDIRGLSAMIYRSISHHRIRYILGATGEGRRRLRRTPGAVLNNIDYVFIESDETVRAWLLSNPVLDDPLDLLVYCYRDRHDKRAVTPPLHRINYLHKTAVRDWARDAAQGIGQIDPPRRAISVDRPVGGEDNDADEAYEDDTSNFDETATDLPDSVDRSKVPFTILPSPVVGVADWPATRIPLLAKSLSQLNRQLPLKTRHPSAQAEYGPMDCVQFDDDSRMEETPEKRRLNYLLKEFRRSEETRKRRADIDAENTEDPKSKRVYTGAGHEIWTGELMDSMARRLSEMST
jgi:hypothetical protein